MFMRVYVIRKTLEGINVKTKYWHCIDNKLWDEVAGCFAEDSVADYPDKKSQGKEAIADYLKNTLGRGPVAHEGYKPSIEISSDTKAKGTWEANVSMTDVTTDTEIRLHVFYEDEYAKEKGEWKIGSTKMRIVSMERPKT